MILAGAPAGRVFGTATVGYNQSKSRTTVFH